MGRTSRFTAVVIAVLLAVPPPSPAVAQDAGCAPDAPDDVNVGPFPPADIMELCYTVTPDALVIHVTTAQPLDPTTDPAWVDASIRAELYALNEGDDPGGDPVAVTMDVVDGVVQVVQIPLAFDEGEDYRCEGSDGLVDGVYEMVVPWDCIRLSIDGRFWILSLYTYFRAPDGSAPFDLHNDGLCCIPRPPAASEEPPPEHPAPPTPAAVPGQLTHGARLDGGGASDPLAQAILTSRHLFDDGAARRVVLATADRFPDALAGAALAGTAGPVLFTSGLGGLDTRVAEEIRRVTGGDGVVLVMGGTAAISETTATEARAAAGDVPCTAPLPPTCRFAGGGREETATLVAGTVAAEHPDGDGTVLLARSDDFADALTGGAFAARAGVPILLTPTDLAHPAAAAFLAERPGTRLIALGGAAAISEDVLDSLPAATRQRVAGPERTATAAAIADQLWRARGLGTGGVVLVNARSGAGWQTALAAAVASAVHNAPQLAVEDPPVPVSDATRAALGSLSSPVQAFGNTALVSDRQVADAAAMAMAS